MKISRVLFGLTLLFSVLASQFMGISYAEDNTEGKTYTVYYFFPSIRCAACLEVERLTKLFVMGEKNAPSPFQGKVENGVLSFKAINVDIDGNKNKYSELKFTEKVPLIVEYQNNKPVRTYALSQAWFLYTKESQFIHYAREALTQFMAGEEPAALELGQYISTEKAYDRQKTENDFYVVDVRTPEEHVFVGHPENARNIPFLFMTHTYDTKSKKQGMKKNPEFLNLVKKNYKTTDHLAFLCRSGPRAAMAVTLLQKNGFKNLYVIEHGFEGDVDGNKDSKNFGKRALSGWKNENVPWTYKLDPEKMFIEK